MVCWDHEPSTKQEDHDGAAVALLVVVHLQGRLFEPEPEDPNEEIDVWLARHLTTSPWKAYYDLGMGLTGLGVYALERRGREQAIDCLELVIDRLDETAVRQNDGWTWPTPPHLLPPETRARFPEGYCDLGVAHGVPGVIGLLAAACAAGIARRKAEPLLHGAIRWLQNHKRSGARSLFANFVGPGHEGETSRLAWCYGDAGIAAMLLNAARQVGEEAWQREALAIARHAASRRSDDTRIEDAGLCHGAAGVGHIFHRLYHASGEALFADTARFWYRRVPSLLLRLRVARGLSS